MHSSKTIFILLLVLSSFSNALGQEELNYKAYFQEIEEIVRANSSRALAEHLFDKVEIKINGNRKEYSKSQAEAVLKNFFQDNSATTFDFVHDGKNSGRDLIYAIGDFVTTSSTYRLVMRAKKFEESYKIFRIEFTKER